MDQPVASAGVPASDLAWSQAATDIVSVGRRLDRPGWVPATSGNLTACTRDSWVSRT